MWGPVTIFLLLRLPSLAVDHIIRVMDPLEQLLLCRTSRKIRRHVRRLTKNYTFHLTDSTSSMSFGYDPEKSSLITIRPVVPYNKVEDNIYPHPAIIYSGSHVKALAAMAKAIQREFNPKDFSMYLNDQNTTLQYILGGKSVLNYLFTRDRAGSGYQAVMSNRKEIPELSPTDTQFYLGIKDATWATFDGLKKVLNHSRVHLFKTSFTSDQFNQFCGMFVEKWMTNDTELVELRLGTPGHIALEVAGGVLVEERPLDDPNVESFGPTTCYAVERADGKKVYICCKENKSLLWVQGVNN